MSFDVFRKTEDLTGKVFGTKKVLRKIKAPDNLKRKEHTFWECLCSCGNLVMATTGKLKASHEKQGCRKCAFLKYRKAKGECSFNGLYLRYKHGAQKRSLVFSLDKEDFRQLTKSNCYYCNIEPLSIHKGSTAYGEYIYNGIDRLDNDTGYTLDNCVACCFICNRAKGELSVEQFVTWLNRVKDFCAE